MYTTFGHTRARYFGPETGGLIFQGTAAQTGVFRIDHDQAFQQTTNVRYQYRNTGPWFSFIWRYDSGLVMSGVPDVGAATGLTPAQQVDIGFSCDGITATLQSPITSCNGIGRRLCLLYPKQGWKMTTIMLTGLRQETYSTWLLGQKIYYVVKVGKE